MKNMISTAVKASTKFVGDHAPELLTALGVGGMLTSVIFAVKATPKAVKLLDDAKEAKAEKEEVSVEDVKLNAVETVKATWKVYVPTVATVILSAACIIGSNNVNHRRNVALVTAYTLSETTLKEYRDKVVEKLGEKQEKIVRDEVAKDKLEKNPITNTTEVFITEKGNTLCYDSVSGRYFKSDMEKIKRTVNEMNARMFNEMYVSLNEFYYELGLEGISIGDDLGWNIEKGYLEVDFSSHIADDGTPCLVLDYLVVPKYNYQY